MFRIGRLVGRAADGVFQYNPESNAFYCLIQGLALLKAIPASLAGMPVEITPVDVCAEAVLRLENAPMTTYHIVNPRPATLAELLAEILPELKIMRDEELRHLIASRSASSEGEALAPLIEMLNRFSVRKPTITISSEKTQENLEKLGYHWPELPARRLLGAFIPTQTKMKAGGTDGI